MSVLPAPPKKNWMPPASPLRPAERMPDPAPPAPAGIRLAGAWLAIAAGLATLVALMVPYAASKLAPILIPALVLLLAGLALLATIVERRGRAAERVSPQQPGSQRTVQPHHRRLKTLREGACVRPGQ